MHLSPTNVCIPAIAIKSRVDNALLTKPIFLGVSDFGKSPTCFRQPPLQGAACGYILHLLSPAEMHQAYRSR